MLKDLSGEELPDVIVYILTASGFDSKSALMNIGKEHITNIEEFFNAKYEALANGLKGSVYENDRPFKILPGHCALIEDIPRYLNQPKPTSNLVECNTTFSRILKSLIDAAVTNSDRNPTRNRYDEIIRYFSTYLYLMSGKSCYETLSANLPIPQANTICE